jgi:hypothetical protein
MGYDALSKNVSHYSKGIFLQDFKTLVFLICINQLLLATDTVWNIFALGSKFAEKIALEMADYGWVMTQQCHWHHFVKAQWCRWQCEDSEIKFCVWDSVIAGQCPWHNWVTRQQLYFKKSHFLKVSVIKQSLTMSETYTVQMLSRATTCLFRVCMEKLLYIHKINTLWRAISIHRWKTFWLLQQCTVLPRSLRPSIKISNFLR